MLQNPPPFVNLLHVLQNRRVFLVQKLAICKTQFQTIIAGPDTEDW